MASRRKGRILAFQALYAWDANSSQAKKNGLAERLMDFSWTEKDKEKETTLKGEAAAFPRLLFTGTVENIAVVDKMIQEHLENWDLKRLNRVDLAVLRMSVYTLMFQTTMPPKVVIDEAIDISREFGTDDSYRFVNGVLDGIRKTLAGEKDEKSS